VVAQASRVLGPGLEERNTAIRMAMVLLGSRDVHSVAEISFLDDHVALVDADTEFDAPFPGQRCIALEDRVSNLRCAAQCVHNSSEMQLVRHRRWS
jgi:hypothetical protein